MIETENSHGDIEKLVKKLLTYEVRPLINNYIKQKHSHAHGIGIAAMA